jgi:hypothetical protein
MEAVYRVIRNRSEDARKRWPRTLSEVVLEPYQFSSFNKSDPQCTVFPVPGNKLQWDIWQDCVGAVRLVRVEDITKGANFYHDTSIAPPFQQWLGPHATLDDLLKLKTFEAATLHFYRLP